MHHGFFTRSLFSVAPNRRFLCRLMVHVMLILGLQVATSRAQAQWDPAMRLSAGSRHVWSHGIAASGEVVHMIWGRNPIRYRRSTDAGATWSRDVIIAASGITHLTDPLVAEGSDVYVVYLRHMWSATDWCCRRHLGDLYVRHSRDGGLTWEPETRLTTDAGAFRISMAVSDARVHVVWSDFRSRSWEIYYQQSRDRGHSWLPEVRLVPTSVPLVNRPQIAAMGDHVHVVVNDARDNHPPCYTLPSCGEVYYKRSVDGGETWDDDLRLTFDPPFSGRPDVTAVAPSTVLVSFDEDRDRNDGHEQYIIRSTDHGATWEPPVRLSFAPGTSEHSALVASGSAVHLAWFDRRLAGHNEIYYRTSLDGGATWEPEEQIAGGGDATTPLLAATPKYVHVIWLDRRTGSYQVWYRRRRVSLPP